MNDKDSKQSPVQAQHTAGSQPYLGENAISLLDLMLVLRKKWRMILVSFLVFFLLSASAIFYTSSENQYSLLMKLPTYNTAGYSTYTSMLDTGTMLALFDATTLQKWKIQKLPLAKKLKISVLPYSKDIKNVSYLNLKVNSGNAAQANYILEKSRKVLQASIVSYYNTWLLGQNSVLAQKKQQLAAVEQQIKAFSLPTPAASAADMSRGSLLSTLIQEKASFQAHIVPLQWQLNHLHQPSNDLLPIEKRYIGVGTIGGISLALFIAFLLSSLLLLSYYVVGWLRQQMHLSIQDEEIEEAVVAAG